MTRKEKKQFIADIIKSLHSGLLEKLPNVPEGWNGIEMREWIKDYYTQNYTGYSAASMRDNRKARRDYNNTLIVNNLT